jgi:hypothetical protein
MQMVVGKVTSYMKINCGPLETLIISLWLLCSKEFDMPDVERMKQGFYLEFIKV